MSEEINKIIDNLEGCIGMFDYLLTPIESNLLVSYIKELQQENQKYKEAIDKAIEYNEHLIRDAKYHLNLGHLKKMKKILEGEYNE